jgi:hypothetical protein
MWIDATEYVLSKPHRFICDDCQIRANWPMHINYAYGKCHFCGIPGINQVYNYSPWAEKHPRKARFLYNYVAPALSFVIVSLLWGAIIYLVMQSGR